MSRDYGKHAKADAEKLKALMTKYTPAAGLGIKRSDLFEEFKEAYGYDMHNCAIAQLCGQGLMTRDAVVEGRKNISRYYWIGENETVAQTLECHKLRTLARQLGKLFERNGFYFLKARLEDITTRAERTLQHAH